MLGALLWRNGDMWRLSVKDTGPFFLNNGSEARPYQILARRLIGPSQRVLALEAAVGPVAAVADMAERAIRIAAHVGRGASVLGMVVPQPRAPGVVFKAYRL
jgi:hypothetical protein